MLKKSLLFLLFILFASTAIAQTDYPERPIKFLVAAEPGSANDITSRYIATKLSEELGQKVIVENPYGEGGSYVMHMLLSLKSDGYTIAATDLNPFGSNIYEFPVRYQIRHIAPLAILHTSPLSVIATRENSWFDIEDVFKPARETGRRVRVAYADNYALNIFQLIGLYEDVEIFPIQQESEQDVYRMLEEGYADIAIVDTNGFERTLAGDYKTLASTGSTRYPSLPYALTLKEQGYEKAVYDSPFIVSVPVSVPENIKQVLIDAIVKITSSEEYLDLLDQLNLIPTIQGAAAAKEITVYTLEQVRFLNKVKEDGFPVEEPAN